MIIEKRKSIREQVYETLRDLIINGEIEAGERVVEVEYAEKFHVSRTPVREAIRMLELEGLVEVNSKGGVLVKEVTSEDIKEIYKIRIALEGVIIEEIITNNHSGLEKLENLLQDTENLIQSEENCENVVQKFADFNDTFYSVSELKRVVGLIKNMNLYLMRFRKISIGDEKRRAIAYKEHKLLVKALRKKDLQGALEINKKHLEDSMEFILKNLKKRKY
ncbi:MAG: GntR family transcriptional regulator [Fusobacteriaceae bacterium]